MQGKFLKVGSLAVLQIILVGNLQSLPIGATYGAALPFLYLVAVIGFFIPCGLMVAELATSWPQTGGAYIWAEKAFGVSTGFFTICILWISNLLWYPSIFTLIAVNAAYLYEPSLAHSRAFIIGFSLLAFWTFTALNCLGIKSSIRLNNFFGLIGVILPMILIIAGGIMWCISGEPMHISLTVSNFMPGLQDLNNPAFLMAIAISLFGLELSSVHAGDVVNPKKDFPRSLLLSGIILVILLLLSELAISAIVPAKKLNLVTGLLDALEYFFYAMHMPFLIKPVLFLVFLGNVGSIGAWMLGSTRGMYIGCKRNDLMPFLQKVNKREAPVGVLVFEAILFTLACSVFLLIPKITDSFWLLLALSSQVSLVYYIILFCSALRLRAHTGRADGYQIPGGKLVLWLVMGLGILTSIIAFMAGFISPIQANLTENFIFHLAMWSGLVLALFLPLLLLLTKREINETRI